MTDAYFQDRPTHLGHHLEACRYSGGTPAGIQALELGTGWYPVVPVGLFLAGANEIITVDVSSLMDREKVLIDGEQLKPILDKTAYVESSMLRSRFIKIPERVPLNTAMIGVVITYLTDGIPQEVETTWDLFSDRVQKVTARMTDPAGPFPYDLEPGDNVLKWTNFLKNYTIPMVERIVVEDTHRGLLLPEVASERGWDTLTFLDHLCLKANLPPGSWKDSKLFGFTTTVVEEKSSPT